jgi:hypothetical protein
LPTTDGGSKQDLEEPSPSSCVSDEGSWEPACFRTRAGSRLSFTAGFSTKDRGTLRHRRRRTRRRDDSDEKHRKDKGAAAPFDCALGDRPSMGRGEWAAGCFQNAPSAGWFLLPPLRSFRGTRRKSPTQYCGTPSFLLIRERRRRAPRLSLLRAVAAASILRNYQRCKASLDLHGE